MDPVRVRLLGGLVVGDRAAADLGSRKARRLVAVLALARGQAVHPDRLVDLIWEGEPSHDQLPVVVSRLRAVLGRDRLPRSDAGYALVMDWLDLDELSARVEDAAARLGAGSLAAARSAAGAALALATGPLLPEEPDAEWVQADRLAVARLVSRAELLAAEAELRGGDPGAAVRRTAALLGGYDEGVLRLHLSALAAAGRTAQALVAFQDFRERLADELGADPSPETQALHRQLLLGAPATATAPVTQLAGRSQALARLTLARGAVLVRAGAGLGKTRLVDTWVEQVRSEGRRVLVVRGLGGRSLAWQPVLDSLQSHLHRMDPDAAASLLGDEAALLDPLLGRAPVVGVTLDLLSGAQGPAHVLLARALEAVLRRAVDVLVVDDAHLADAATLALLERLATSEREGLLVVATARPEDLDQLAGAAVLDLAPLDLEATEQVVGPARARVLYDRSGGNPLLLVELAAAEGDELPDSVRSAVNARADRTGPAAATLRAAAVLATEIDLDLLAAVLKRPAVELLDELELGARHGLLSDDAGVFAFRHALVREALESGVGSPRRALLHREAARVLWARTPREPLRVARHALQAGERRQAGAALVLAAAEASARYDAARAQTLLDEAIEVEDDVPSRVARCRVRLLLGRYDLAQDDADEALGREASARTLEVVALCAYYAKDFARAVLLADEAAADALDDELRVRCRLLSGRASHAAGDLTASSRRLLEAEASAPPSLRDMALTWTGSLLHHQGDPDGALQRLALAHGSAGLVLPHTLMMRALALAAAGRAAEAVAAAQGLALVVERMHLTRFVGRSENVRGYLLRHLGSPSEADELTQAGLEGGLSVEHLEPQAHALLDLADGCLLRGDFPSAAGLLDQAEPYGDRHVHPHTFQWRHVLRARLLRSRLALADDPRLAEELASALLEDSGQVRRYAALARLAQARARLAQGVELDLDVVERDLLSLASLAGLEQWRLTADLADDTGSARLRSLAQDCAAALVARAGDQADPLRAVVAARFS